MVKVSYFQVCRYAGIVPTVVMVYLWVIQATLQYGPDTITSSVLQHFDRVKIPIQIIVPVSLCCGLLLHLRNRKTYRHKFAFEQLWSLIYTLICIYCLLTYIITYENLAFCDDEERTAINSTITVQPMLLISFKPAELVSDIITSNYSLVVVLLVLILIPFEANLRSGIILMNYTMCSFLAFPTLFQTSPELLQLMKTVLYVINFYLSVVMATFSFVHSYVQEVCICGSILMINSMTAAMREYISALISTNVACCNNAMATDITICPLSHFSNSTYKMCSTPPTVFPLLDNPYFLWFYHVILTTLFLEFMFLYYPSSVQKCFMQFSGIDRAFGRIVVLEIYKAFSSKLKNGILTDTKNDALVNFVQTICNNDMDDVHMASQYQIHKKEMQCATTQPTQNISLSQSGASNKKAGDLSTVKESPVTGVNILEAAGSRVMQEYFARCKEVDNKYTITKHGVVMTSSGYLSQYKKIFHILMSQDSPAKFRNAVHMALCLADKEGMRSIAFPALNSPAMVNSYLRVFYNFERESRPACLHSIEVLTSCEAEQDYHETKMSEMGESLY